MPAYEEKHEVNSMMAEEQAVGEEPLMEEQKSMATDSVTADSLIQDTRDMQFEDDLSKTMVLPDIKKGQHRKKALSPKQSKDILTADTIDLGDALDEIRNTTNNEPQQVHDAIVLEPVDAVVNEPIDLETVPIETVQQEVLEPMEEEKDAPTLDSLLQSINLVKSKKKSHEWKFLSGKDLESALSKEVMEGIISIILEKMHDEFVLSQESYNVIKKSKGTYLVVYKDTTNPPQ